MKRPGLFSRYLPKYFSRSLLKLLPGVLVCCFTSNTIAQVVPPLEAPDSIKTNALHKAYNSRYEGFNRALRSDHRGSTRKYLENVHQSIQGQVLRNIKKDAFILDERFTSYVEEIKLAILERNPSLKSKIGEVLVSRRISPNALSLAEGSIFLNAGLFSLFDNKAQLTAVLCHEMAHKGLEHSSRNLLKSAQLYAQTKNSRYLKSFRATKGRSRSEAAFSRLKQLLYSKGAQYRKQEKEADSLGYLYYKNLGLPAGEYIRILDYLKDYDSVTTIDIDTALYRKLFNLPNLLFREEWIETENYSKYHYEHYTEKITRDSLKTHPENDERIAHMIALYGIASKDTVIQPDQEFQELKTLAKQEEIANLYFLEEYGQSIYLILHRLQEVGGSDDPYLHHWLGKNLQKLYEAKKAYRMNRYVDRISPNEQDPSYLLYLNLMWKLKLDDLKALADFYST